MSNYTAGSSSVITETIPEGSTNNDANNNCNYGYKTAICSWANKHTTMDKTIHWTLAA